MKSYEDYVVAQSERNPCLSNLCNFLADSKLHRNPCRIALLRFLSAAEPPIYQMLDEKLLHSILQDTKENRDTYGHILILEDLTNDVVEVLGASLNIDPFFFAAHIHAHSGEQTPQMVCLPSRAKSQNFVNLHYHRVLQLKTLPFSKRFVRDINVPRMIRVLPRVKDLYIGLEQQCCSILQYQCESGGWLCLMLVDPPLKDAFLSIHAGDPTRYPTTLNVQLYQGGFEDFPRPFSFDYSSKKQWGPVRHGLFEDIPYYWREVWPPPFDIDRPCLLSSSYYPLKIVAAEWVSYVALMHLSIKHYEYTIDNDPSLSDELMRLTSDLHALQSWRRRSMATQRKLSFAVSFIKSRAKKDFEVWDPFIEDFEHISTSILECSHRLDTTIPVVTSLIQIVDTRRSFAETSNISRLTYLALAFVPLSFVASLFSMNSDVAPGGQHFWIYLAVAIPVSALIFLLARAPLFNYDLFNNFFRGLKRGRLPT